LRFCATFFLFTLLATSVVQATCDGPVGMNEGNCAPDFLLKTPEGKEFSLASLAGKVVFLHFWATWCPPCEEEMPSMEATNRRLGTNKFQMLAVSIDEEGWPAINKFLKKTFLGETPSFPVFLDSQKKVAQKYGTVKVPETFIIDQQGRIVDKVQGTKEWRDPMILHYLQLLGD
jgi:thiol-disulfide isomerase/thioredoxin